MAKRVVVVAGGTGDLGRRVVEALVSRGATVRALVRADAAAAKVKALRRAGAKPVEVDFKRVPQLRDACAGAGCVVSTLSGLREVIVDAQTFLLDAAVLAKVPRFIPSDFAVDFTHVPHGANRNFDLRQEFKERLDAAPIRATSILNGAFAELLQGQAPIVVPKLRRVVAWGTKHPKMDFTTRDDTAAFTARAAMDPKPLPRKLRIAGGQVTAEELAALCAELTGRGFKVFTAGPLKRLDKMIGVTRALDRGEKEVFPAWQGMQYLRDMYAGYARLGKLDNNRYPDVKFTTVREVLARDERLQQLISRSR